MQMFWSGPPPAAGSAVIVPLIEKADAALGSVSASATTSESAAQRRRRDPTAPDCHPDCRGSVSFSSAHDPAVDTRLAGNLRMECDGKHVALAHRHRVS